MSGGEIGDVEEKFRSETEVIFEWRIPKIFSIPENVGICYNSPSVSFLDRSWYLYIYPNGRQYSTKEWIALGLDNSKYGACAMITLYIKTAEGTRENKVATPFRFDNANTFRNSDCRLHRSILESCKFEIAPLDVLTIACSIRDDKLPSVQVPLNNTSSFGVNANSRTSASTRNGDCTNYEPSAKVMVSREAQTESVSDTESKADQLNDINNKAICTLQEHLKDFLLDGDDHDVTFKVKDREFKAHRGMLRARSPVFSAMFKHDMKESTDDPIAIDDCSPEAFGEFLQFVYTGKIENFSPHIALGVYYAADKYNVSGLTEVCVEFLKTSLSTTAICDVITLAAKYGEDELHELAMTFFVEHVEEVMITKEWKHFFTENFDYANEMCLKAFKSRQK